MPTKAKKIEVRAAYDMQSVHNDQCDLINEFETIAQAKVQARRYLTDDYMHLGEMSRPFRYAAVYVNDECLYDYFRKGYMGNPEPEDQAASRPADRVDGYDRDDLGLSPDC